MNFIQRWCCSKPCRDLESNKISRFWRPSKRLRWLSWFHVLWSWRQIPKFRRNEIEAPIVFKSCETQYHSSLLQLFIRDHTLFSRTLFYKSYSNCNIKSSGKRIHPYMLKKYWVSGRKYSLVDGSSDAIVNVVITQLARITRPCITFCSNNVVQSLFPGSIER